MLVSTRGLADANIASMLSNLTVGIVSGETLDEALAIKCAADRTTYSDCLQRLRKHNRLFFAFQEVV